MRNRLGTQVEMTECPLLKDPQDAPLLMSIYARQDKLQALTVHQT
jgi:hypothetical protein